MSYLTTVIQVYGGTCISKYFDVFTICLYFSNIDVQGFAPRGGTSSHGLHRPLWAMKNGDVVHSLEDVGDMMYSSWCDSLTPTILHLLQTCKKKWTTNKCGEKHLLYHILWQLGVKLHWLHLRDHCPSPLFHIAASMTLIMIPYAKGVLIFVGNMIGRKTNWLDVSLGEEISHAFCTTCFKGSM